ncbi:HIT family protein [Alteribacillus sp. HJP-4]|uniref:HIT family protein n=1 Tax=Alteribacillus sp. HJP-4 TaxID=2775394 RepID=UPI0035CD15CD
MKHDDNCIFCKIVTGDIPASIVYEDDDVIAFTDIGQVTKGHTLLIPKDHQPDIYDLQPETAAKLFGMAPKIANAIKSALSPAGMNLVNNNGKAASQSVFHFHLHFIPRYGSSDGFQPTWEDNSSSYSAEDLKNMAESISKRI